MKQKIKKNVWMFRLVWNSSKGIVMMKFFNSIINPIRNLGVEVLFIGMIYNAIDQQRSFQYIVPTLIIVMSLFIINGLLESVDIDYITPIGKEKLHQNITKMLIKKAAVIPLSSFDDANYFNDFVFSAKNGADQAMEAVQTQAFFIGNLIGSIFAFGIIAVIDPVMLLFSAISLLLSMWIIKEKNIIALAYQEEKVPVIRKEEYMHKIFCLRNYAQELRFFPLQNLFMKKLSVTVSDTESVIKKHGFKLMFFDMIQHVNQNTFMYWGAMLYVAYRVAYVGSLQVSDVLVATIAVGTVSLLTGAVVGVIPQMTQMARYADKLQSFLNREGLDHSQLCKNPEPVHMDHSLKIEHLTFTYPNETVPTLRDINLELHRAQRIAIVGNNGSGKTTLIKLLMRFYDPDQGRILLDGKDIRAYEEEEYRSLFGTVFQDFNAYALSVKENIIMDDVESDEKRFLEAVEKSGFQGDPDTQLTREFYDTGLVPSGGQLQKMAISRVYYHDSPIIILDEPSSALDPKAEYELMQRMMAVGEDRTVVMISHRLSNIKKADCILYLEDGKILEQGTHEELIAKHGKYQTLYQLQAERYQKFNEKNKLRKGQV